MSGRFQRGFRTFAELRRWKQHVPYGDPTIQFRADVAALVTALGGDSVVLALYDSRLGITVAGGKVAQWDDARGAIGFGPSLVPFSTSPGPAYDAQALTATFNGTSGSLISASATATFDPSVGRSLVYVGNDTSVGVADHLCGIGTTAQNLNIFGNGAGRFSGGVNGTVRNADSAVTFGTRRVVFLSVASPGSGAGTMSVEAPTHAPVSPASGGPLTGNGNVTFGWHSGVTTGGNGVARVFMVLNTAYTTGQRDSIAAWAVANHFAVLA